MQRIEDYLQEPEVPVWASPLKLSQHEYHSMQEGPVSFRTASFEWHGKSVADSLSTTFRLGPLDVTFPTGKLTLVSGATGSGKTALLMALLGGDSCLMTLYVRSINISA